MLKKPKIGDRVRTNTDLTMGYMYDEAAGFNADKIAVPIRSVGTVVELLSETDSVICVAFEGGDGGIGTWWVSKDDLVFLGE